MNSTVKKIIRFPFELLGLQIHRKYGFHWRNAKEIIKSAKLKGMTVGEYLEVEWNQPGLGKNVFDHLKEYGILDYNEPRILEVGAGSGRYLEETIKITKPEKYEVYELDDHWAEYLEREFKIKRQPTNGTTFEHTEDASIDIVLGHGIFNGPIEFIDSMIYLNEFFRVIKDDGLLVFDIFSEECLRTDDMKNWLDKIPDFVKILPADFMKDLCKNNGLIFQGSFFSPLLVEHDGQYLVFKKGKVNSVEH
ncbi:class I SAM-dependent methyltransferase [Candidatus Amoebophilus asiaticus]|nr:class I SAM-dependent methyltransferase [Candidatus Amoebophilus asiaticus]